MLVFALPDFSACNLDPSLVANYFQQYEILIQSQHLGAKVYPFTAGLALVLSIAKVI